MIVTQNESGVKPGWKKTARAVVVVSAGRAKCTRRGWWIHHVIGFSLTETGEAARMESKQLERLRAGTAGRFVSDREGYAPCPHCSGSELVAVATDTDEMIVACYNAWAGTSCHYIAERVLLTQTAGSEVAA